MLFKLPAVLLAFIALTQAHTPAELQAEAEGIARARTQSKRLDNCRDGPTARSVSSDAIQRRAKLLHDLRESHGYKASASRSLTDLEKWSKVNHNKTAEAHNLLSLPDQVFATNATCAMSPEGISGPYYVAGELIRRDIRETQQGMPVYLDIQFVDVNTCEPIPELLVECWHSNSTGSYSGVDIEYQGAANTTFLRGVQISDNDGYIQFLTNFPGHYYGRATHIHIMTRHNATVLPNNTYVGGNTAHMGQLFADEALRAQVETLHPYTTDTWPVVSNLEDSFAPDSATADYDPYIKYAYITNKLQDGIVAWIDIALDPSADYTDEVVTAAHWYGSTVGGVPNPTRSDAPGAVIHPTTTVTPAAGV